MKKTKNGLNDKESERFTAFYNSILPLAKKIKALKATVKELGGFAEDRELLECSGCGLMEDVTFEGKWIVYKEGSEQKDSGLRFISLDDEDSLFRCPSCGIEIKAQLL
jgi:hypothetical protein